jgi:ketol-acid reductoisomerase
MSKQLFSKLVHTHNQAAGAEILTAKAEPSLAVIGCGYWGAKHIRVGHDIGARVSMAVDMGSDGWNTSSHSIPLSLLRVISTRS